MKILVSNAGSTSLKFKLFDMEGEKALCDARVERVGVHVFGVPYAEAFRGDEAASRVIVGVAAEQYRAESHAAHDFSGALYQRRAYAAALIFRQDAYRPEAQHLAADSVVAADEASQTHRSSYDFISVRRDERKLRNEGRTAAHQVNEVMLRTGWRIIVPEGLAHDVFDGEALRLRLQGYAYHRRVIPRPSQPLCGRRVRRASRIFLRAGRRRWGLCRRIRAGCPRRFCIRGRGRRGRASSSRSS